MAKSVSRVPDWLAPYPTQPPFYVPTAPVYKSRLDEESKYVRPISPPRPSASCGFPSTYSPIGYANKPLNQEEENGEGEEQLKEKPREVPRVFFRDLTQEERKIYNKIVVESDGFDCPYVPPDVLVPGILKPVFLEDIPEGSLDEEDTNTVKETLKELEDMAALALKDYNQQSGKLYQFVKVVKACWRWDHGTTNNITFQAKEDAPGSAPQNFQARVFKFLGDAEVVFCRLEELCKPPSGPKETSQ